MNNNNFYPKLNESPDSLVTPDGTYLSYEGGGGTTIVFGWFNDTLYFSDKEGSTHGHELVQMIPDKEKGKMYINRDSMDFPGRLWTDFKIISFWEFPDETEMYRCLIELSEALDVNIIGTGEWVVNYYNRDLSSWKNIPLSEYIGSDKVPKHELEKDHERSPLLRKNKQVPDGVGSKHNKTKPLDYKQAMTAENENNNFYPRLFESPDRVMVDEDKVYFHTESGHPVVFGWLDNKLYTKKGFDENRARDATHGDLSIDNDFRGDSGYHLKRYEYDYPGRLWLTPKIISFWIFPSKEDMPKLLDELSKELNIVFDDEWQISIYDKPVVLPDPSDYPNKYDYEAKKRSVLFALDNESSWSQVPLKNYTGAGRVPKSVLMDKHKLSPIDKIKSNDNTSVPDGVGSKHSKTKPLDYKQAMTAENENTNFYPRLFENPDGVVMDTEENDLQYHDGDAGSVTFGWYKNALYTQKARYPFDIDNTHTNMAKDHDLQHTGADDKQSGYYIERADWEYPGRLWTKAKVITFWKFPKKGDMSRVLSELSNKLNIQFDDEWQIDIFNKKLPDLNRIDFDNNRDYRRAKNERNEILDDEDSWKLIPLSDYTGSGVLSQTLISKPHEASPISNTKQVVPDGVGSKHNKTKPLDYKQAMYNESEFDVFDNFLLEKLLVGEPVTIPELRTILNKKVLNFEFVKLDGEVRPAKGTTMMKYIPKEDQPSGLNSPSSDKVAAFYDLSKDAWRSVSNRSKEVVIATDDSGKPKIVISDKKPKAEKEPKPPVVNGKESPKPVEKPVEPVVEPTIVPDEIPDIPDIKGDEFDDKKKALDTTDSNVVADEIDDDDIIVDDEPREPTDDELRNIEDNELQYLEDLEDPIIFPDDDLEDLDDMDDNILDNGDNRDDEQDDSLDLGDEDEEDENIVDVM